MVFITANKIDETRESLKASLKKQFTVEVTTKEGKKETLTYITEEILGCGSFGVVAKILDLGTNKYYALKITYIDPKFYQRELEILLQSDHPNIINVICYFYHEKETQDENGKKVKSKFLNIILPLAEFSLDKFFLLNQKQNIKSLFRQALEALNYLHQKNICHRDIKPSNILIDNGTDIYICDLGSAKVIQEGAPSVAYICSRFYRSPENLLGSRFYGVSIDIWAIGLVFAEFVCGKILFPGQCNQDQLNRVLRLLHYTKKDKIEMGITKSYKGIGIEKFLTNYTRDKELIEVLSNCIVINPKKRLSAEMLLKLKYFAS